ncbi:MAG TPA: Dps family protein [Pseudomonadales bacterium]
MAALDINIGLEDADRKKIASGLTRLLADSYTLYLKTHGYHWNVTGPRFRDLHLLFEEQYTELAGAVDAIAERIRTLGFPAPGTFREFLDLTSIEEASGQPSAEEMIRDLTVANEIVVRTCREILPAAQKAGDESTVSLVAERMAVHEKAAWMLRSLL